MWRDGFVRPGEVEACETSHAILRLCWDSSALAELAGDAGNAGVG